jgi:hypothetical protein
MDTKVVNPHADLHDACLLEGVEAVLDVVVRAPGQLLCYNHPLVAQRTLLVQGYCILL